MLQRTLKIACLIFILVSTPSLAQDDDFDGVDLAIDLCPNTVDPLNEDTDGDGIGDICDVDDDNDGIMDIYDCEIAIPNYSFENGFSNWSTENSFEDPPLNTVSISPTNDGPFPGAEGLNYLDIEAYNETVIVTSSNAFAVYEETGYILEVSLGDLPMPLGTTVPPGFFNDGLTRIELGYGNNSAAFTPIPGAALDIDGPTETQDGWSNFRVPLVLGNGNPAIGEGILIRISHTGIGGSAVGLAVDFVRLSLDSDGDGISNCKETDSDNDGCYDVIEAGHDASIDILRLGQLDASSFNLDGSVNPVSTGYTGNTAEVLNFSLNTVCNTFYADADEDNVEDTIDLDDDNDGILDIYDCEIPILNSSFENTTPSTGWTFSSPDGGGIVNPNSVDDYFYASDGNNYGFLNGNGTILLNEIYASYELGSYILSIDIGDGLDYFNNPYRNDGTSELELGYLNDVGNFISVNSELINPQDTPNGIWSTFTFPTQINEGDLALGEGIVIRITHTSNNALSQRRGDYDNISLKRDRDNDGIADCFDRDSDNDGCPDVREVGHLSDANDQLLGTSIDPNGLVSGYATGYSGLRQAYFDENINSCMSVDTDGDGLADDDSYYFLANGNTAFDEFDLDNDNDGISDVNEGCTLTANGFPEEASNFEQVPNSQIIIVGDPTSQPFVTGVGTNNNGVVEFFNASNPLEIGTHLVNAGAYINPNTGQPYSQNYFTDGTLQPDIFDATNTQPSAFNNDQFAFVNGDGTLTQLRSYINIEQGGYVISLSVGDGLDYANPYRNDGTTLLEVGFGNLTNFNVLANRTIYPHQTPNGTWTDFTVNVNIPANSPAIGQEILLRITHTGDADANQLSGNYDNIRISKDTDNDGIPDCLDSDSDNDGCPDATEAGYTNDDNDNYVGNGPPTVNGNGLVVGTDGYTTPVSPRVRSASTPATISNNIQNSTVCEGQNSTFTVTATRLGTNPAIEYQWSVSTNNGTTWTTLQDYSTGTTSLTVNNANANQNNYQYRVRVRGNDNFCYDESVASLTVNQGPGVVTVAAVNTAVCAGENAAFTITGDAGDTVTYSLDAGATSRTAVVGATGTQTITLTAPTANVTIDITSVEDAITSCVSTLPTALSATVVVNPTPSAPINPVAASSCQGNANTPISVNLDSGGTGDTVNWYAQATGGTSLGTGLSYTSVETNTGTYTYYAEAANTTTGCVSATRTAVAFTILPAVTADIVPNQTACDSYTLPTLTSGNYFTASGGTGTQLLAGESITNSQTIYVYAESGTTPNCSDESSFEVRINQSPTLVIASIDCAPDLATYEVVFNSFTGVLNASAGTVNGNTISQIPSGTNITVSATNNSCTSTPLEITAPNCNCPTLDTPTNPVGASICEGFTTPTLSVTLPSTGGDTIQWYNTPTGGTVLSNTPNFTPTDTAPGTYTYYAETFDSVSSCTSLRVSVQLTITQIPVADVLQNQTSCDSYTLPTLSPNNFYYTGSRATGTLLNAGDLITSSQTLFIYNSSPEQSNCADESSFTITINPTPELAVTAIDCSLDFTSYEVRLEDFTGTLSATAGTVLGNTRIIDIPAGTNINITATNATCTTMVSITAPDCSCPDLDPPVSPINASLCEGASAAALGVSLPTTGGDTILWYTTETGGTPIAMGTSYTPIDNVPGLYTYYAETQDSETLCLSSVRTPVTLRITAIPTVSPKEDIVSCEVYTLPTLPLGEFYYTAPNAGGQELQPGYQVTSSQTIYVTARAATDERCASETSFSVTILQEPILTLPASLSLCVQENSPTTPIYLGTDLGPGYRYDWTPDNDTNADGIEEPIFEITRPGTYTLEVYQIGANFECGGFTRYSTVVDEVPQPLELNVEITAEGYMLDAGNRVRLLVNDDPLTYSEYEYSITNEDGPFQDNNIFANVDGGLYTGYVRAKSGCGVVIASEPFLIVNYPTFFTPNGDGVNETWKPLGLENLNISSNVLVDIYDKHGKFLTRLDPLGSGWDGNFNNVPLTPSDYWFKVYFINELTNQPIEFNGHFSLKR